MPNHPQLLFLAGPNGAGKSTYSKNLSEPGAIILTSTRSQSPAMPKKQVYLAATQDFFNKATEAIGQRQHFTLETNFRDDQLVDVVAEFKRFAYTTNFVYLTLDNIEQSTDRVNQRVLNGGHYVDLKNIRFDNVSVLDASKDHDTPKPLLQIEQQLLVYLKDVLPASIQQTIINIADRYGNNPRDNFIGR